MAATGHQSGIRAESRDGDSLALNVCLAVLDAERQHNDPAEHHLGEDVQDSVAEGLRATTPQPSL